MQNVTLDAIDRKILKFLIKNARMPFLEIARECGISGAAIHQRIRKLDEAGVILGSRLIVDPKMLGFDVCAHISITLKDPQLLKQTVEHLKEVPEIVECHFITGQRESAQPGRVDHRNLHFAAGGLPAAGQRRFPGGLDRSFPAGFRPAPGGRCGACGPDAPRRLQPAI